MLAACAVALALAVAASAAWAVPPRSVAPPADPEGGKAHPNSSPLPLQAFLLTSAPDSFVDLQAHVGAIGAVYPTYFECSPGGEVVGAADAEIDAYSIAHGLVEMPRFSCQDGALVHRILTQPPLRARVFARLVELASDPAYAGLNLDLENDGARDRGALSAFVAALAAHLHAEGRRLAVDVVGVTREIVPRPAAGFYDYRALVTAADTVFVMAGVPIGKAPAPARSRRSPSCRASPVTSPHCRTRGASCSVCRCTGSTGRSPVDADADAGARAAAVVRVAAVVGAVAAGRNLLGPPRCSTPPRSRSPSRQVSRRCGIPPRER